MKRLKKILDAPFILKLKATGVEGDYEFRTIESSWGLFYNGTDMGVYDTIDLAFAAAQEHHKNQITNKYIFQSMLNCD